LRVDRRHKLMLFEGGVVMDTRDDEISPSRGYFHQIDARVSPFANEALPHRYIGFSASLRFYLPLRGDRLVLAARAVGDALVGHPPFYELSRYDETSALGGAKFVRGVPANRYYGKRKVLGNLEVRSLLYQFGVGKSRYELGFTGFVDTGRVWADLDRAPSLDGTGLGLKYGVGGGLRLQKGKTFVLRGDLAWSPDARPLGGYFLAGHIF
jgi:outer membrane protein assembly factor BamA